MLLILQKSLNEDRPIISGKKIAIFIIGTLVVSAMVSVAGTHCDTFSTHMYTLHGYPHPVASDHLRHIIVCY